MALELLGRATGRKGLQPCRVQLHTRLQQEGLAGLACIHCACCHVPSPNAGPTPATRFVVIHIPAATEEPTLFWITDS